MEQRQAGKSSRKNSHPRALRVRQVQSVARQTVTPCVVILLSYHRATSRNCLTLIHRINSSTPSFRRMPIGRHFSSSQVPLSCHATVVTRQIFATYRSLLRSNAVRHVGCCHQLSHGGTIMIQQSRRPLSNPQTGGNNDARTSPLQAIIVKPEQALPIKPFGLDLKVLLTTEATGGAISVLMGWLKPGERPVRPRPFQSGRNIFHHRRHL